MWSATLTCSAVFSDIRDDLCMKYIERYVPQVCLAKHVYQTIHAFACVQLYLASLGSVYTFIQNLKIDPNFFFANFAGLYFKENARPAWKAQHSHSDS